MGAGDFLPDGQLGGDALPNLFRRPAAHQETPVLGGGRTGGADDFFKLVFGGGLEQKRDDDEGERTVFFPPSFRLREPGGADARVQDGFEPLAGGGAGKNNLCQHIATEAAVRREDFGPEAVTNFGQSGLAGLDELAGNFIGIHDAHTQPRKETGGRGFAHPDAAGQTAEFHAGGYGPTTAR